MLKIKSKIIALLSSTALLATILTGCGSSSTGADKDTPSAEGTSTEPVTLTLLIGDSQDTPGFRAVVEEIEKRYNIKTEVERRPGGPEGENIMRTRLATGDMADLAVFNSGSLLKTLNPEQNFVDLSNEPYMASVFDSFKQTVTFNGKVFGVPVSSSQVGGWLYNKKVYEELGLTVPNTWDELMANNEKIKAAGKTAVIGSYKTNWTAQLVVLADYHNVATQNPNFADEFTANKAKFGTDPAALRGFEKLEEIGKKGYLNKDFNSTTYDQALKMLAEGTGVHYPMITQALPLIDKNFPDKVNDIGIFPQPGDSSDKNGFTTWMSFAILVNKNTEKMDAAKKWLEFYISPEAIAIYESKSKSFGPYVVEGAKISDDAYTAVKDMMPYFDQGKVTPALEFLSPVKGPNLPQISTEIGGGMTSAIDGAKAYDKDVEKQAKQLGLPGW